MSINDPTITGILSQNKTGKWWPILYLVTLATFVIVLLLLQKNFDKKQRFILMDDQAYYVVKEVDFTGAREMHLDQAELAALTLLSRNPSGFDFERRLKYLFSVSCYQKAVEVKDSESPDFEGKSLHQKVEVFETKIQKMSSRSVQVLVQGQLIRTGIFEGEVFTEVLRFQLRMTFSDNPSLVENGRFPTVVTNFGLEMTAL